MERAEDALELLDRPTSERDRAASLADVDRLNRWFGGHALTMWHMKRLARRLPREEALRVLDLGTGSAGLAVRLARWGRRTGRRVRVIAVDVEVTPAARRAAAGFAEIKLIGGEATALPLRRDAVGITVSELLLHHLPPEAATVAFTEQARVSRHGFLVNDLWRSRLSLAAVWLATRLLHCHPISRHDGPLSVRRSYSAGEIRALAARAGVRRVRIHRYPWLLRILVRAEP